MHTSWINRSRYASAVALCLSLGAARADAQNRLTSAERADGWRLLFDGTTLNGWRGLGYDSVPTAHWKVVDGTIMKIPTRNVPKMPDGQPANGGDLMTVDTFRDFEFAFEWKAAPGMNSGVKYNVSEEFSLKNASNHAALGFEYQVLDDSLNDDNKIRPIARVAVRSAHDERPEAIAPGGRVNTSRIVFRGNHGEHWLNGAKSWTSISAHRAWTRRWRRASIATRQVRRSPCRTHHSPGPRRGSVFPSAVKVLSGQACHPCAKVLDQGSSDEGPADGQKIIGAKVRAQDFDPGPLPRAVVQRRSFRRKSSLRADDTEARSTGHASTRRGGRRAPESGTFRPT
jgi:hypothetical protein